MIIPHTVSHLPISPVQWVTRAVRCPAPTPWSRRAAGRRSTQTARPRSAHRARTAGSPRPVTLLLRWTTYLHHAHLSLYYLLMLTSGLTISGWMYNEVLKVQMHASKRIQDTLLPCWLLPHQRLAGCDWPIFLFVFFRFWEKIATNQGITATYWWPILQSSLSSVPYIVTM